MDDGHISEPSDIATLSLLLMLLLTCMFFFYRINNSNCIFVPENIPNRFQRARECMSFSIDRHQYRLSVTIIHIMKVQGVYQIAVVAMLFLLKNNFQQGCKMVLNLFLLRTCQISRNNSKMLSIVQCFYLRQDSVHIVFISNKHSYLTTDMLVFCLKNVYNCKKNKRCL